MTYQLSVVTQSGDVRTVEGAAAHTAHDASEIRIEAIEAQAGLCRKGGDLLVNFDDGETVRLVNFYRGEDAPQPAVYFRSGISDAYIPFDAPVDGAVCQGLLFPVSAAAVLPGAALVPALGQSNVLATGAAAAVGGAGAAAIGEKLTGDESVHAPVFDGGDTAGAAAEAADGAPGENATVHKAEGGLPFTDRDEGDAHTAVVSLVSAEDSALGAVAERGTLTATVDQGPGSAGTVLWRFEADDSALDGLAEGQTVRQVYEITLDDGHGNKATKQVAITLTGTNDAPEVRPVAATVAEDASPVSLSADFLDVDVIDTHTFSIDTTGTLGQVVDNGDGIFFYDPNGAFDALGQDETATDSFTYTVRDSSGAESTETVTITVTGVNEAPTAANVALARSETFEMGFESAPDFAGWSVDDTTTGAGTGNTDIDRSGTLIPGDAAVAVLEIPHAVVPSGSTSWGPTITSDPLVGRAGDSVEIDYVLNSVQDAAHMELYMINLDTGARNLLHTNTASIGSSTGLQTATVALPESGTFAFEIRVGSTDSDNGTVLGGVLNVGAVRHETDLLAGNKEYVFEQSELLAGASDPNGDPLEIVSVSAVSAEGASVFLAPDGRIHYDASGAGLTPGQEVTDTFTFTVSDGHGGTATATASVSVMGVGAGVSTQAAVAMAADAIEIDLSMLIDDPEDDVLGEGDAPIALPAYMTEIAELSAVAGAAAPPQEIDGGEAFIA